jgi:hypothetical protein
MVQGPRQLLTTLEAFTPHLCCTIAVEFECWIATLPKWGERKACVH